MYYVIHGRRTAVLLILLAVIGITFWYSFYLQNENSISEQPEQIAIGNEDEEGLSEPAVEVLAGGVQRTVSELDQNVVISVSSVPTKFVEYRIEREKVKSRQLELLKSMLDNNMISQEKRSEIQTELYALLDNMVKETEIENLLKVNGYLDAVVLIENESVTVVVPVMLSKHEVEIIGNLVHRITDVRMDRITIVDELTESKT